MLEELSDYALVNKPLESFVNGTINLKNSHGTQIGDRYHYGPVTYICPNTNEDNELTLKPGLLESAVAKSNGFQEKTDNNNEVCIANEKKFKVRRLHILAGALALVLIATIATLVVVFAPSNTANNDYEDGGNGTLVMVGRQEWGAIAVNESFPLLQHPTKYILISHTSGRLCQSIDVCSFVLRYIQKNHIEEKGFGDIGYNFLIGDDGRAYIGRGWDIQGRHTKPFNSKSIGIAFIGTFTTSLPPKRAFNTAQLLIAKGVELGKLSENYTVFAQKQVILTESPGLRLIQEIKKWPHWHTYDPLNDQPGYTSLTPPIII